MSQFARRSSERTARSLDQQPHKLGHFSWKAIASRASAIKSKGPLIERLGKAIGDAKLAADGAAERAIGDEQNVAGAGGDQLMGVDAIASRASPIKSKAP